MRQPDTWALSWVHRFLSANNGKVYTERHKGAMRLSFQDPAVESMPLVARR